jgi:hypothetical protein
VVRVGRIDIIDPAVNGGADQGGSLLLVDRTSGLLVRRVIRLQTPMGRLPIQVDYADYRDVEGVKLPFEVKVTNWENVQSQKFTDVKVNAVAPDRFQRPAGR